MARADEALGGLDEAHRAAEVHAARGDRDERLLAVGRAVDLLVARPHVDGRLADLADARHDRDDARDVGVGLEVVRLADRLPGDLAGARTARCRAAKPSAGSVNAGAATAPAPCAVSVIMRRRVTVSPSKAPAKPRSSVYLRLRLSATVRHARRTITTGQRREAGRPTASAPLARLRPPGGFALGMRLGGARDHVGQHGHGFDVAERGQPRQAERVEAIAGQQRQVGVVGAHDAPLAVVLEIALADRLDDSAYSRRRARLPRRRTRPGSVGVDHGGRRAGRPRRAARPASASRAAHAISANAAAAASSVRSRARSCARAKGTRPRTGTAAGRRRAPAWRGTTRRRPRGRRRAAPA